MKKESLEHLSSLIDGELSRETGLFITSRLSTDEELRSAWKRYHLIRDCIRGSGEVHAHAEFTARVNEALSAEAETGQASPALHRWLKPLSGMAIAASVAMMAISLVGPVPQGVVTTGDISTQPETIPFTSPNSLSTVTLSQPASFNPEDFRHTGMTDGKLNSYLMRHNQLARVSGVHGFVSYVPMIATRSEPTSADASGNRKNPHTETGEAEVRQP